MTPSNNQWEFLCPFHEQPGALDKKNSTNFYMNHKTSQYYCQSGSCGEKGNLQTLEKYFGVIADPTLMTKFKNKDTILKEYQSNLRPSHREFLAKDKGMRDIEIDRFRLGFDPKQDAYVIPYLVNRRPIAFRYYDPQKRGPNGSKYWWERAEGYGDNPGSIVIDPEADGVIRLFNPSDADGGADGRVYICEGEFKAMLLTRHGLAAVSIPGASSFKAEWAQYFMKAKEVIVVMDNDNPLAHQKGPCRRCSTTEKDDCSGHNPGQEAAAKIRDFFAHRAKNVVLPLPDENSPKTDINEYLMRDAHTFLEFQELVDGKGNNKYIVRTLSQVRADPPPETVFLVGDGLLPKGGRLLVTGAPKTGKSIFIENLALSIAAGVPFLKKFPIANDNITPGHRVLLLDRELSERSLFDRLDTLIENRPALKLAEDKLLVDHKFSLILDQEGAGDSLINLIRANNAEVIILDTAYKFFQGDVERSSGLRKAFDALDYVIKETGVSVVLTHHQRKGSNSSGAPDVDSVVGSFLWTGWVNGTVLLNFKNRSVQDPFTTVASFVAFRDAAQPDPLLLGRSKESLAYTSIQPYSFDDSDDLSDSPWQGGKKEHLNYDNVANALLAACPVEQTSFLHASSALFGCKPDSVQVFLLDILDRHPDFVREGSGSRTSPYMWRYVYTPDEEAYDQGTLIP
jgi:hypothetical protein